MPYNPAWDRLVPCTPGEVIDRCARAGITLEVRASKSAPEVRYLVRLENGVPLTVDGRPLRAILSPGVGDRYATLRYFCDALRIPRDLFKV